MLFDFTLAVVFVCFNNVITVLFVLPLFSQHCCIPLYLGSKISQVQNFMSESWMAAPFINLKWNCTSHCLLASWTFYVIKRVYWQYCAMTTSTYIVFVLSCANYYELCCYMHVLAKSATARHIHLDFPPCKWSVVSSNVTSFLAFNSNFWGNWNTRYLLPPCSPPLTFIVFFPLLSVHSFVLFSPLPVW